MTEIAIAISTHNRSDAFMKSLERMLFFKPDNAEIFVVDDASNDFYKYAEWVDYHFSERAGIPRVKNKCLELCMETEAKHIFLFDDDIFPIKKGWEIPYIASGIHHLCYTFTTAYKHVAERKKGYEKDGFMIHSLANGCMMYFTRECINTVGGFDERFGLGLYEHTDLTRRICNAGLTPYKCMDVVGSDKLFHSMDEHGEIERNFSITERQELLRKGRDLFHKQSQSKEYIEYREPIGSGMK